MSSRAWTVRRRSGACFFWAWDLSSFVLSIPRTRQPSKVRRFLYSNFIGAEQLTGGSKKEPARNTRKAPVAYKPRRGEQLSQKQVDAAVDRAIARSRSSGSVKA